MNEKEIDCLLEELRNTELPPLKTERAEAICCGFRGAVRRRLRAGVACLAVCVVLLTAVAGWFLHRPEAGDSMEKLEIARQFFPESGVALIDGEITTCEQQASKQGSNWLKIWVAGEDGGDPVTVEFLVADEDYISLVEGPVRGEFLVCRCEEEESFVIDCDLAICFPGGRMQMVKDAIVLNVSGTCRVSSGKNELPCGARLEWSLETVHRS